MHVRAHRASTVNTWQRSEDAPSWGIGVSPRYGGIIRRWMAAALQPHSGVAQKGSIRKASLVANYWWLWAVWSPMATQPWQKCPMQLRGPPFSEIPVYLTLELCNTMVPCGVVWKVWPSLTSAWKHPSFPDALKCCRWRLKFKYYSLQYESWTENTLNH